VRITAVALVIVAGLTGCYGSTEKASNVDFDSVDLNGVFTANHGAAESWFEYWPTATPANKSTTATRNWAANASGPTTDHLPGLQQGTNYSFRLCGRDQGGPAGCAQTRTFETWSPDKVTGQGTGFINPGEPIIITVNASSGPGGQRPSGTVDAQALINNQVMQFHATTACVGASGSSAIVVATGSIGTIYLKVTASTTPGQSEAMYRFGSVDPNPTCALFLFTDQIVRGDFSVTDAPPPQPPN
jgi:hypothetical protein